MNRLQFYLFAALLCAASIVTAGCAGQPSGVTPGTTSPSISSAHSAHRSWMSPAAKGQALVYVSSVLTNDVYAYSYSTQQLVGTLSGFTTPYGLCSDKKGNVWIVNDGASQLVEYAHGGTSPLATLSDAGEYPEGCSVDPVTGNLAVTNFYAQSGGGSVAIYAGAQGTATLYTDPSISEYRFCGYDNKGNLYVDGVDGSSNFAFAELPKGGGTFTDITLPDKVEWPGAVQWDGKYVAVGDTDASLIYRVKGTSGTIKSIASLGGSNYVNQFWITASVRSKRHNDTVLAASQDGGAVGYYKYPAGGSATTTISVSEPFGVALSK